MPGAPPGAPGAPGVPGGQAAAPKKKGGAGAIIGIVAALAVVGGLVAAYFIFFAGPSSQLSKKVPKDTEIFFEVPDVKHALGEFADMDIIDHKKLDSKKWSNEMRQGLEDAFDIKKDAAEDLMHSVESVAIAQRDVTRDQESVTLISFSSTDGMEKLLKSERFSKEDDVGSGALYEVERLEVDDPEEMSDWSAPKKMFAGMRFDAKSKYKAFVWFEKEKLLCIGNPDYIEDISSVLDGSDSLQAHEDWGKAKFEGGAGIAFISSELTGKVDDDDVKRFMKGYFSEVAPFAGAMKFTSAGVLITLTGEMKGNKISEEDELASPASLDLYEKLPEETIAYAALSTTKKDDGKAAKKWLIKKLKSIEEGLGDEADDAFDAMDDQLDFDVVEMFDAMGDSMVIAVGVDRKIEYDEDKKPEEYIEEAGVAYLIEVGDEDKAKKIVKKLKEKLFEEDGPLEKMYEVDDKGDGFEAVPGEDAPDSVPEVHVVVEKEYVLVTAGGLAKRFKEAAEKGKKTLADDKAHKTAIGSFSGDPRAIVWIDTGWLGGKFLEFAKDNDKMSEELDDFEDETGFSPDAIVTKGDDRLTSAIALVVDTSSDKWDLKLQALNGSVLMAGSSAFFLMRAFAKFDGPSSSPGAIPSMPTAVPAANPPSGSKIGVPECDAYFDKIDSCSGLPQSTKDGMLKARDAMKQAASTSAGRTALASSCKQSMDSLKRLCP